MPAKISEWPAIPVHDFGDQFRDGNLGIMDYYRMQNIQSDTSMRDSIAEDERDDRQPPEQNK